MTPTVEDAPTRIFVIRFKNGSEAEVRADTICPPNTEHYSYRLKLDSVLVAEYVQSEVTGWRIKRVSKPGPSAVLIDGE